MGKFRKVFLLLPAALLVLALVLAGCSPVKPPVPEQEKEEQKQPGANLPSSEDPEYYAYILTPDFWGQGITLEGNAELGYLMLGFNVPAGTPLYAPFDSITSAVSLGDYSSDKTGSYRGLFLCGFDSLNGFSAYNIDAAAGPVKAGDIFAEVNSDEYIFPKHYGKVNLILEFNFFDTEAAGYADMHALFGEIFNRLPAAEKGKS